MPGAHGTGAEEVGIPEGQQMPTSSALKSWHGQVNDGSTVQDRFESIARGVR